MGEVTGKTHGETARGRYWGKQVMEDTEGIYLGNVLGETAVLRCSRKMFGEDTRGTVSGKILRELLGEDTGVNCWGTILGDPGVGRY